MADINEFLKKLGLTPSSYDNSPMDPNAPEESPIKLGPEAFMPAEVEAPAEPTKPGALASAADIAKIQSMPGSEMDRVPKAAVPAEVASPAEPQSQLNKYEQMMKEYQDAQGKYASNLGNVALTQGANQIAQAMASGFGGNIGQNEQGIKTLKEQAAIPMTSMEKKLKAYKDMQGASPWIATDRVDEKGNPIRFNKQTGQYSRADGSLISPGDYTARDILRRDALTGNYGIGNVGSGMKVLPTQHGAGIDLSKGTAEGAKPREVTYGEFAKGAPEQAKQFNDLRKEFNKDMKDSREVATSVTNLGHKLTPGANGEIDAGLLGGIQTQAAKMAGQKGVLTDQDLVKFAGAGGVGPKLERIVDGSLFGNMTDSDIKFFKRFGELMGQSLNEDVLNRAQLYTEQGRQLVDTTVPGVTSENISKMLGVDKVVPIVQNKHEAGDIVTVKGPSGQTVQMKKDVFDAKYKGKEGYSVVGH